MITPAGAQCPLYYEDFARGASRQQCRAAKHPKSGAWLPADCRKCSIPDILIANGSPHLELRLTIRPGVLRAGRRLDVEAWCSLHGPIAADPRVGCPECNAAADELLRQALE